MIFSYVNKNKKLLNVTPCQGVQETAPFALALART